MRSLTFAAAFVAVGSLAPAAHAGGAEPAVSVAVGAATVFAGFLVGGSLIAASAGSAGRTEAGWFAVEGAFSAAPLLAHGVGGEWVRGSVFAAIPTATTLATLPVFRVNDAAVEQGTVAQQRLMWALFCGGLAASIAGIIDATFAPGRSIQVAPVLGAGNAGFVVGGAL